MSTFLLHCSLAALLTAAAGCQRRSPSPPPVSITPAIGPQFGKFALNEYAQATNTVTHGLGGRWISERLIRLPGQNVTREDLVTRISGAMDADGWKRTKIPHPPFPGGTLWDHSREDLSFSRPARGDEPPAWFFNQTIFISPDASVVCVYSEVGW